MNKYYIKKFASDPYYGFCVRFNKSKLNERNQLEISDLHFLAAPGLLINDEKTGWNWGYQGGSIYSYRYKNNTFKDSIVINFPNNIFELETDEDALLCFEVMEK